MVEHNTNELHKAIAELMLVDLNWFAELKLTYPTSNHLIASSNTATFLPCEPIFISLYGTVPLDLQDNTRNSLYFLLQDNTSSYFSVAIFPLRLSGVLIIINRRHVLC
jgi:hypothetical protein